MLPFESLGTVSYSQSILTMAVSCTMYMYLVQCIIFKIKRSVDRKSRFIFYTTPAFNSHIGGGGFNRAIAVRFGMKKLE